MVRCRSLKTTRQALAALFLVLTSGAVWAGPQKPPVPIGTNPGGVKVAIIGSGLDYTRPEIAARLARDGEGEIIGWDFVGDDRRPFASTPDGASRILLSEGQAVSLVVIATNFADPLLIAKALRYAAQSPARIIALQAPWTNVDLARISAEAARHYPDRLFIAGAGDDNRDLDANDHQEPAAVEAASNVIVTTAADANGEIAKGANWGAQAVELAIDIQSRGPGEAPSADVARAAPSQAALARLAALAARLVAVAPELDGAALKRRICALARPVPGAKPSTKAGLIGDPWKPYWLE